jgi:hypothetical protein
MTTELADELEALSRHAVRDDDFGLTCRKNLPLILSSLRRVEKLEGALEKIERWHGELPATGRFWDDSAGEPKERPMSYSAVYGSNGERDYMRAIAAQALTGEA